MGSTGVARIQSAADPEAALGTVLLLDQFPRNTFRGTARMFATDALAREAADAAIGRGLDRRVPTAMQGFFYLPFAHAEDLAAQDRSVLLQTRLGDRAREQALHHRDIIARFGRFPHRNALLGRPSTAQELWYLRDGGFDGGVQTGQGSGVHGEAHPG